MSKPLVVPACDRPPDAATAADTGKGRLHKPRGRIKRKPPPRGHTPLLHSEKTASDAIETRKLAARQPPPPKPLPRRRPLDACDLHPNFDRRHNPNVFARTPDSADSSLEELDVVEDVDASAPITNVRYSVQVTFNMNASVTAVIDSGAWSTWISQDLQTKFGQGPLLPCSGARGADGRALEVLGECAISFNLWGRDFSCRAKVLAHFPAKFILGRKFLIASGMTLDCAHGHGSFKRREGTGTRVYHGDISSHGPPITDPNYCTPENAAKSTDTVLDITDSDSAVTDPAKSADPIVREIENMEFPAITDPSLREELRALLYEYADLFRGVGVVKDEEFSIQIKPDVDIMKLNQKKRKKSPREEAAEEKEVQKHLDNGILESSSSPIGANNVFVDKKTLDADGRPEIRMASDFRLINSVTIRDSYPLEDMNRIVEWLASKKIYSTMDMRDGYWGVPLRKSDRYLTAIRTALGLVQYTRMAMGLRNSGPFYQRLIEKTLREILWKLAVAYQDDVSVGTMDEREHVDALKQLFPILRAKGFRMKLAKCHFAVLKMEGLGFEISHQCIAPKGSHREAMKNYRAPTNGSELLTFLGVVQFFARHINSAAERMQPLYKMLEGTTWNKRKPKNLKIHIPDWDKKWGKDQVAAFEDLKKELADPTFLVTCEMGKPKRLVTDASGIGYGAALLQEQQPDDWRPVMFLSRKLKGAEIRYTATENEAGAVIFALRQLRPYLDGVRFDLFTDHIALKWLLDLQNPKPRLARWLMDLQDFDFSVNYVSGKGEIIVVPDALSRYTISDDNVLCTRCLEIIGIMDETEWDAANLIAEQRQEYGDLEEAADAEDNWLVNEEGVLVMISKDGPRIIVPPSLRERAMRRVHGDGDAGHFGVTRSATKLLSKFYWPGWRKDLIEFIRRCLVCENVRLGRTPPPRQAMMSVYQVRRRFQLIAMDVLTITPESHGYKKLLVIGDMFTRFVLCVPLRAETAKQVAHALFRRWIGIFGPPEQLLTDRGGSMDGEIIRELCNELGTKKIRTTAHHPQTDGRIERHNRVICDMLMREILNEPDWIFLLPLLEYQYNASVHRAIGVSPYEAMFGIEPYDYDHRMLAHYVDDVVRERNPLKDHLREMHQALFIQSYGTKSQEAKAYNKAAKLVTYAVGERVYIFDPEGLVRVGRKIRPPWRGPYRVSEKLSDKGYMVISELSGKESRVHVNRMRRASASALETGEPEDGMYPDSHDLLRKIEGVREEGPDRIYSVKHAGRTGLIDMKESELPETVVKAFAIIARGISRRARD